MTVYYPIEELTTTGCRSGFAWTTGKQSDYSRHAGVLTIWGQRCYDVYEVEESPCDHGRGFVLFKVTPDTGKIECQYAVFCGSDDVGRCECKSFTRDGSCKHLKAVAELLIKQWL